MAFTIGHQINVGRKVKPGTKDKIRKKVKENWNNPEIRKKMTEAIKESRTEELREKLRIINTGKKMKPEAIEKMRLTKIGFKHPEESKQNMSKNNSRYWQGKHFSEGHLKNLSESHKGQIAWNKGLTKEDPRVKKYADKIIGRKLSEEQRKAMSRRMSGENHFNYGRHLSEETRRKIKESQIGKIIPKEQIEKIKVALTGRPISEEHKQKIKEAHKKFKMGKDTQFKKGFIPWNVGLPMNPESKEKMISSMRKTFSNPKLIAHLKKKRAELIIPFKDTSIEVKIQNFLKELNIEFFTHQYISEITHSYQCDILINPQLNFMAQRKTIIEIDGDYWHCNPIKYPLPINEMQKKQREEDICRTEELKAAGFDVLRLWEADIKKMNLEDFKNIIYSILKPLWIGFR